MITEFSAQLEQAKKLAEIEIALHNYLTKFNFKSFALTYYVGHVKTGQKLRYEYASKALQPWHAYYLEQGFADIDRTLETVSSIMLPGFWCVREQLAAAKNNRESRMRKESMQFGIDKGLSVPVHGINHDLVMLTLHQRKGETCLQNYNEYQYEWLSAALLFYHHLKRILDQNHHTVDAVKLTRREEQCLILVANSLRVEQIAKELRITRRTVNFHIQNANKKLGTNNKYLSINKYLKLASPHFT